MVFFGKSGFCEEEFILIVKLDCSSHSFSMIRENEIHKDFELGDSFICFKLLYIFPLHMDNLVGISMSIRALNMYKSLEIIVFEYFRLKFRDIDSVFRERLSF